MDRMIDAQFPMMQMFEYKVRALERNIFSERAADVVQKLALIRRDLITLQRIIRPQVLVLTELEQTNHHFFPDDIDDYFGDLTDHLSTIQDIIDENTEVIESLVDTVSTLSSIRINEVMRILTVISVIMLPLTLVAGIYGMNVPLPFQKTAYSFWVIMGSMLLISIGMLGFFSHKKWL
jgi:magnesium transporter